MAGAGAGPGVCGNPVVAAAMPPGGAWEVSQVVTGRQARRERLDRPGAHRAEPAPVVRRCRPGAGTAPALPQHCSRRHHQPLAHRVTALARPGRWPAVPVGTGTMARCTGCDRRAAIVSGRRPRVLGTAGAGHSGADAFDDLVRLVLGDLDEPVVEIAAFGGD